MRIEVKCSEVTPTLTEWHDTETGKNQELAIL